MFSRFMPREGKFFDLFNEHATLIVEGSHELAALMASGDDLERRAHKVESIEKRGDKFVLADQSSNGTFVTIEGDSEFVLHREEFILRKKGCISFGQSRESSEHYIEFSLD